MPTLFGAHKFEQVRTVAQWLVPIAMEKLHKCVESVLPSNWCLIDHSCTFTDAAAILHNYSVLSEILAMTQCFSCLCDVRILRAPAFQATNHVRAVEYRALAAGHGPGVAHGRCQ